MRYIRNYILVICIVSVTLILGSRLLWYFFIVDSYNPEWFILIMGLVFIGMGIWVAREWYRLHQSHLKQEMKPTNLNAFYEKFDLSGAEREVLELLATGLSNTEIADARSVSINTVKTHVSNIYQKLGVRSRVQVLARMKNIA